MLTPTRTPGNSSDPETVSDTDREVARVLNREAGQIKLCRSVLDDYHNFLAEVGEPTFYLQFIPRYGEAAKTAIELATVNTALTDCTWQLYQLHSAVNQNAAKLQQAVGRYSAVADGAVLPRRLRCDRRRAAVGGVTPIERPCSRDLDIRRPPAELRRARFRERRRPAAVGGGAPGGRRRPHSTPPTVCRGVCRLAVGRRTRLRGAGPLGSLLGPLAGFSPVDQAASGQPSGASRSPARRRVTDKSTKDKASPGRGSRRREEGRGPRSREEQGRQGRGKAASGVDHAERAPVHIEMDVDPDRLDAPVTVTVDPDNPPVPPAATTPSQSTKGRGDRCPVTICA